MSREAMQQALDALEKGETKLRWAAISALKQALAEPEPKPVAWMCPDDPDRATAFAWNYGYCVDCGKPRIPLFTTRTGDSNE